MKRIFLFFLPFFFIGCYHNPPSSQAVWITYTSPTLRFSDSGFISPQTLQIFSLGHPFIELSTHTLCIESKCYPRSLALTQFWIDESTTLDDIIAKRPLKNLPIASSLSGFCQKNDTISYCVDKTHRIYKNYQHHIELEIEELP